MYKEDKGLKNFYNPYNLPILITSPDLKELDGKMIPPKQELMISTGVSQKELDEQGLKIEEKEYRDVEVVSLAPGIAALTPVVRKFVFLVDRDL